MTRPATRNSPQLDRAEAAKILTVHGITPTIQRMEIASVMLGCSQHLSAEQLLSLVNQGQVVVSKATVYNTLGLFAQKGLVREVIVDPTKVFYDSNTSRHHHFYDTNTGTLTDINEDQISIGRLPTLPEGTVIDGIDVVVRLCSESS